MIDRRTFVKAGMLLGAGFLAGCTQGGSPAGEGSSAETPEAPAEPKSILVAFFSRAGENYGADGIESIEVGNTKVMAGYILEAVDADEYEIVPAEPYPDNYDECLDRASMEQAEDARPEIANPLPSIEPYEVVFLGCPVWWGEEPMIIRTFLESVDLVGKTVIPFTTSGGSGLGSVPEGMQALEPDATFLEGHSVRGEDVSDAHDEVVAWVESLDLDA